MKRIVSVLLVLVFLFIGFAACNSEEGTTGTSATTSNTQKPTSTTGNGNSENNSGNEENNDEGQNENIPFAPILRFAVASDLHVSTATGKQAVRTTDMLKQVYEYAEAGHDGYSKLDAILIGGDITENGYAEQFKVANDIFKANIKDSTELILAIGNHDSWDKGFGRFEAEFGKDSSMRDEVINGYHFISIYGNANNVGSEYTTAMRDELEKRIQAAIADTGTDKPVFVLQHVPDRNTVMATDSYQEAVSHASSAVLYDMKTKYSNLVVFAGHTHCPNNDEASIWQGDFTEIGTGSLFYSHRSKYDGTEITMANKYDLAQCYIVEVDSIGRIKVRCLDILQKKFVGDTWFIDSYDPDEFKYTVDRFVDGDIFFADGAKITLDTSLTSSAILSFPPTPAESLPGRVYEVLLWDNETNKVVSTQRIGDEYFKDIFDRRIGVRLEGLVKNREYSIEVTALNSLYSSEITHPNVLRSNTLELDFKHTGEITGPFIDLEIDANKNTVSNKVSIGLDAVAGSGVTTRYDDSIKSNVVVFNGSANGLVNFGNYAFLQDEISDSFTVETYFKVNKKGNGTIIGGTQHGGFTLQVKDGKIRFLPDTDPALETASYTKDITFDYVLGQYYHVIIVFDGEKTVLYANGEQKGSIAMTVLGLPKNETARVFWLGADVNGSGNAEASTYGNCSIADFKLYANAFTAKEIADAIAKAPVPPTVTPEEPEKIPDAIVMDMQINATQNTVTNAIPGVSVSNTGTIKTEHDTAIDKDVLVLDGSGSGIVEFKDYSALIDQLRDSMSVEMYLKVPEKPASTKKTFLVCALQSGGFGLEAHGPNNSEANRSNKIMFFLYNGAYVGLGFEYEVNTYYHIVATFDGGVFKLYVDGELIDSMNVGPITFPSDSSKAHNIVFGGDVAYGGGIEQAKAKLSIAEFKVYNYELTAAQVTAAYNAAK